MPYDVGHQLTHVLSAAAVLAPIAQRAGVSIVDDERYDEWEDLITAINRSFLVPPIVDSSVALAESQFARIGFEFGSQASDAVCFGGRFESDIWLFTDILSPDGISFCYLANAYGGLLEPRHLSARDLSGFEDLGLYRHQQAIG